MPVQHGVYLNQPHYFIIIYGSYDQAVATAIDWKGPSQRQWGGSPQSRYVVKSRFLKQYTYVNNTLKA